MVPSSLTPPLDAPVVFFDGACGFCNRSVRLLASRDTQGRLRFAHLQGAFAAEHLPPELRDTGRDGSVVLLEPEHGGGRVSLKSAAVLRALAHTAGPRRGRWLERLADAPRVVRVLDRLYGVVARHRAALGGRSKSCALPDPAWRARFLG